MQTCARRLRGSAREAFWGRSPPGSSPNRQRRGARAAAWLARGGGLLTLLLISHTARWVVRDTPANNVFAEHSGTLLYLIDVPLLVCLVGWLATLRHGSPLRFPLVLAPTVGLAALSALGALWAEARPMLALEIGARLALLTGFALYLASGQAGRWLPVAALIGGAAFQAAIAVLQFARGAEGSREVLKLKAEISQPMPGRPMRPVVIENRTFCAAPGLIQIESCK